MSGLSCTSLASRRNSNKELVFPRQRQQTLTMTENIPNYSVLKWKQEEVFWKLTSLSWWGSTPRPTRSNLSSLTGNCNILPSQCCSPCLRMKLSICPSRCLCFPCSEVAEYSQKWRPLTPALPGGTTSLSLMIQVFLYVMLGAGPVCVGPGGQEKAGTLSVIFCPFGACLFLPSHLHTAVARVGKLDVCPLNTPVSKGRISCCFLILHRVLQIKLLHNLLHLPEKIPTNHQYKTTPWVWQVVARFVSAFSWPE